jgi:hypothetical protein
MYSNAMKDSHCIAPMSSVVDVKPWRIQAAIWLVPHATSNIGFTQLSVVDHLYDCTHSRDFVCSSALCDIAGTSLATHRVVHKLQCHVAARRQHTTMQNRSHDLVQPPP